MIDWCKYSTYFSKRLFQSIPGGLSLAVSEAVKAFNASHGNSWPLSYKDVSTRKNSKNLCVGVSWKLVWDDLYQFSWSLEIMHIFQYTPDEMFSMNLAMSDNEPSLYFNNSIIISNYEVLLSNTSANFRTTFLKTTHHFMVWTYAILWLRNIAILIWHWLLLQIYTGVLNKYMREVINNHTNLFYTRPDPDAATHALYKITKSILDKSINSSKITFVLSDSPSPYINVWLIYNKFPSLLGIDFD